MLAREGDFGADEIRNVTKTLIKQLRRISNNRSGQANELVSALRKSGHLPDAVAEVLLRLLAIGSRATNGGAITRSQATDFQKLGPKLAVALDAFDEVREHPVRRAHARSA